MNTPKRNQQAQIMIRCSAEEKQRWAEAANADSTNLSHWIRLTLHKASKPTTVVYAHEVTAHEPPATA